MEKCCFVLLQKFYGHNRFLPIFGGIFIRLNWRLSVAGLPELCPWIPEGLFRAGLCLSRLVRGNHGFVEGGSSIFATGHPFAFGCRSGAVMSC